MIRFLTPIALAAALLAPVPAVAQQTPQKPHIAVTGQGEASVRPDMALVNLSVMREAESARGALDQNNQAMQAVIAALKAAGIADRDLQTSGLSIQPRYDYFQEKNGNQTAKLVAYQVINSLSVRVRDLARVGEVIDSSVSLGVNQGGSITFTNDNPDAAIESARRAAVTDAMTRARTLAEAAGVSLGTIMEITEQADRPQPMPFAAMAMRKEGPADSVPLEAGENSYQVRVNMTFELKQ